MPDNCNRYKNRRHGDSFAYHYVRTVRRYFRDLRRLEAA
jgi:hypothetical protein